MGTGINVWLAGSVAAALMLWPDPPPPPPKPVPKPVVHQVVTHHLTTEQWYKLAVCESGSNPPNWTIVSKNGLWFGGLQITAGNAKHYGYARPDTLSVSGQIALGELILRDQGLDAWPVCSYKAGLR